MKVLAKWSAAAPHIDFVPTGFIPRRIMFGLPARYTSNWSRKRSVARAIIIVPRLTIFQLQYRIANRSILYLVCTKKPRRSGVRRITLWSQENGLIYFNRSILVKGMTLQVTGVVLSSSVFVLSHSRGHLLTYYTNRLTKFCRIITLFINSTW